MRSRRNFDSKGFKSNEIQFYGVPELPAVTKDFIASKEGRSYLLDRWRNIVTAYSKTDIAFQSDRAIAISGVGRVLAEVFGQDLVEGLWMFDILGQLLWSAKDRRRDGTAKRFRPRPFRAPTWSWLSVEGLISLSSCTWQSFHYELLDLCALPQVSEYDDQGFLRFRGRLRACRIRQQEKLIWGTITKISTIELDGHLLDATVVFDDARTIDNLHAQDDAHFLMLGGTMNQDPTMHEAYHHMFLLRCKTDTAGVFERIGIAFCDIAREPHGPPRWRVLQQQDHNVASLPCINYAARTGLHTIMVV